MNIEFIHPALRTLHVLVAALDALILVLFFGPPFLGLSVRWIRGLEDWLPAVALIMLYVTIVMMFTLFLKGVRFAVFTGAVEKIVFTLMLLYAIVSGVAFVWVYTNPV